MMLDSKQNKYYNGDSIHCSCVECFTNRIVEVLGGDLALYMCYNYRFTEAHCPECERRDCPRAETHENLCDTLKDEL